MVEFRTLFKAHLATLHSRVYYQVAPEDAVYPYLVYDIPTYNNFGEHDSVMTVDVDGWDYPTDGDTTALETLMDTVRLGLNKKTLTSSTIGAVLYLSTQMAIQEDDKRIKRRKLIFEAHLFEGSI